MQMIERKQDLCHISPMTYEAKNQAGKAKINDR